MLGAGFTLLFRFFLAFFRILPLRQRREDIVPLVEETCIKLNKKHRQKKRFSHMALLTLKS